MIIPMIVVGSFALLFVPMALMGIFLEASAPKTAVQSVPTMELREN